MTDPTDPTNPAPPTPDPARPLAPGATYDLLDEDPATTKGFTDKLTTLCEEYGIGVPADIPFVLYVHADDGRRFYAGFGCPACAIQDGMLAVMTGVMTHYRQPVTAPDGTPLAPEPGTRH